MFDWYAPPSLSAAVCLPGCSARVRPVFPWGSILPRQGAAGTGKLLEYQPIARAGSIPRERIARTTMSVTQEQVHAALKEVIDPSTGKDFIATKSARNIKVEGGSVSVEIELGSRAGGGRSERWGARCRYLWTLAADDARHRRSARVQRRQDARAYDGPRHPGDLDRLSHRHRYPDGLARADGDPGPRTAPQGHPLEGRRLPHRRHAARNRRHPAH